MCERNASVIAVAETWLKEYDATPGFILDKFAVYRRDRLLTLGGGVAILVRKDIQHLKLDIEVSLCSTQLGAVTLLLPEAKVTVACVYRSPGATNPEDEALIEALDLLVQRPGKLYILGDFNLPGIDWAAGCCTYGNLGENFIEWMNDRALHQHVTFDTRFRTGQIPSLLDLVISKSENDVASLINHPPIGKSDHLLIEVEMRLKPP